MSETTLDTNGVSSGNGVGKFTGLSGAWKQAAGFGLVGVLSFLLVFEFSVRGPAERREVLAGASGELRSNRDELRQELRGVQQELRLIRDEAIKQTAAVQGMASDMKRLADKLQAREPEEPPREAVAGGQ